ncbi:MAG: glycosyltransferase, partial [Desulfobacteraceae bacterium]|nr:glycosyltransferase [Desulfobacteraceae bacterium]
KKIIFLNKKEKKKKENQASFNFYGQSVAKVLVDLKNQKFSPDIIVGHSGAGTSLYVKDVFPNTPFLCFFEWFHSLDNLHDPSHLLNHNGTDNNNLDHNDLAARMSFRNKNLSILADLSACDQGICPTKWQREQFPKEFSAKLAVMHEGINTDSFLPLKDQKFKTDKIDLSDAKQLVTYTVNVLAPYPGFQQFMESIPQILKQNPDVHFVITGLDRLPFKDSSGNKKSYTSLLFDSIKLDKKRVHFIDSLTQKAYKILLQASSVHVYIDSPLVVSRSLLEAMASECIIIAPDVSPVKEVIKDGSNGFIADFSSPKKIAEKILACLGYPSFMKAVKQKARQTIVETYEVGKVLPEQLTIMKNMMGNKKAKPSKRFG